jgi:hypothetical protein
MRSTPGFMCPSIRDHGGAPSSRQVDELLDELAVGPRAAQHLTTGAVIRCCLRARWSHGNQLARSRHPGIRPLRCSGREAARVAGQVSCVAIDKVHVGLEIKPAG